MMIKIMIKMMIKMMIVIPCYRYPRDEAVPQDELSGWDKEF